MSQKPTPAPKKYGELVVVGKKEAYGAIPNALGTGRAVSDNIRHDYPTIASYETALANVEQLDREHWTRGCLRVEKMKARQPAGRSISENLHYRMQRLEDIQPGSFKLDDDEGVMYLSVDFMQDLEEYITARDRALSQQQPQGSTEASNVSDHHPTAQNQPTKSSSNTHDQQTTTEATTSIDTTTMLPPQTEGIGVIANTNSSSPGASTTATNKPQQVESKKDNHENKQAPSGMKPPGPIHQKKNNKKKQKDNKNAEQTQEPPSALTSTGTEAGHSTSMVNVGTQADRGIKMTTTCTQTAASIMTSTGTQTSETWESLLASAVAAANKSIIDTITQTLTPQTAVTPQTTRDNTVEQGLEEKQSPNKEHERGQTSGAPNPITLTDSSEQPTTPKATISGPTTEDLDTGSGSIPLFNDEQSNIENTVDTLQQAPTAAPVNEDQREQSEDTQNDPVATLDESSNITEANESQGKETGEVPLSPLQQLEAPEASGSSESAKKKKKKSKKKTTQTSTSQTDSASNNNHSSISSQPVPPLSDQDGNIPSGSTFAAADKGKGKHGVAKSVNGSENTPLLNPSPSTNNSPQANTITESEPASNNDNDAMDVDLDFETLLENMDLKQVDMKAELIAIDKITSSPDHNWQSRDILKLEDVFPLAMCSKRQLRDLGYKCQEYLDTRDDTAGSNLPLLAAICSNEFEDLYRDRYINGVLKFCMDECCEPSPASSASNPRIPMDISLMDADHCRGNLRVVQRKELTLGKLRMRFQHIFLQENHLEMVELASAKARENLKAWLDIEMGKLRSFLPPDAKDTDDIEAMSDDEVKVRNREFQYRTMLQHIAMRDHEEKREVLMDSVLAKIRNGRVSTQNDLSPGNVSRIRNVLKERSAAIAQGQTFDDEILLTTEGKISAKRESKYLRSKTMIYLTEKMNYLSKTMGFVWDDMRHNVSDIVDENQLVNVYVFIQQKTFLELMRALDEEERIVNKARQRVKNRYESLKKTGTWDSEEILDQEVRDAVYRSNQSTRRNQKRELSQRVNAASKNPVETSELKTEEEEEQKAQIYDPRIQDEDPNRLSDEGIIELHSWMIDFAVLEFLEKVEREKAERQQAEKVAKAREMLNERYSSRIECGIWDESLSLTEALRRTMREGDKSKRDALSTAADAQIAKLNDEPIWSMVNSDPNTLSDDQALLLQKVIVNMAVLKLGWQIDRNEYFDGDTPIERYKEVLASRAFWMERDFWHPSDIITLDEKDNFRTKEGRRVMRKEAQKKLEGIKNMKEKATRTGGKLTEDEEVVRSYNWLRYTAIIALCDDVDSPKPKTTPSDRTNAGEGSSSSSSPPYILPGLPSHNVDPATIADKINLYRKYDSSSSSTMASWRTHQINIMLDEAYISHVTNMSHTGLIAEFESVDRDFKFWVGVGGSNSLNTESEWADERNKVVKYFWLEACAKVELVERMLRVMTGRMKRRVAGVVERVTKGRGRETETEEEESKENKGEEEEQHEEDNKDKKGKGKAK